MSRVHVKRFASVCLISVLALLPVAPLVCDVLCDPDLATPVATSCHQPAIATEESLDGACSRDLIAAVETVLNPSYRLQQRSSVAIHWSHSAPEGAAALRTSPRIGWSSITGPPLRAILRV